MSFWSNTLSLRTGLVCFALPLGIVLPAHTVAHQTGTPDQSDHIVCEPPPVANFAVNAPTPVATSPADDALTQELRSVVATYGTEDLTSIESLQVTTLDNGQVEADVQYLTGQFVLRTTNV